MKYLPIVLLVLFCQLCVLPTWADDATSTVHKPTGVFASSGWRDRNALSSELINGILVRAPWRQIEPSPGQFDFHAIEMQRKAIIAAGKQWSLAILAGPNAPAWLTEKPFNVSTMTIKARTRAKGYVPTQMPCFWDATVLARFKILAEALAEKYNDDPTLVLVYVPQMTANGIEGHFNANWPDDLRKVGLTGEKFIAGATAAARHFANALTNKAVAIEVHEILGDASIPKQIITELWEDPKLEQRVGAGMWWISGKTQYQTALIQVLKDFPGDIYAQVIGRSDQTHRFPDGDYTAVFKQARALGIRYVEVWEYELKTDRFADTFQQFNRDTHINE
ncbi:MAG: beta-galactosidase [Phycisphaeraceae bacterium JB051]